MIPLSATDTDEAMDAGASRRSLRSTLRAAANAVDGVTATTDIRHRLSTHGLPRLRNALDLTSLPVTLEFRFTTKTGTGAI